MKKKLVIMFLGLCLAVLFLRANAVWITKRLTYNSGYSEYPDLVVDSNNHLHLVWDDNSPGNFEIYYKKSTDSGATWTTKRLTYNSGYSSHSSIAVDSNDYLHVVWDDSAQANNEIFYKKSTDNGMTWITKRISYNSGYSYNPFIAVDSNNHLHVVWYDDSPGNDEIYCKKSTDSGATWTTKRLTYNSGDSRSPSIAADSNDHLHLVWYDETPGNNEIYYKKCTDGGATWMTKRLTYNSGDSYFSSIVVDSQDHLHVVWADLSYGGHEICYKKSTDSGATWTTKRLTYNFGSSQFPDTHVDSYGNPYVVWHDNTPGNYEIYYKWSTDGGSTWTTERLTYSSGDSFYPAIAVDSNNHPHVLWQDDSPGNYEIYFKKR